MRDIQASSLPKLDTRRRYPMAARKKPKTKVKRKKTPAKKPATRKKTIRVRKKPARKKPVVRRAAPKKKPAARPAPKAAPAPLAGEERIGTVTHYYSHLSVAVVRMESGSLRAGDTIHVWGHTSDFRQRVESIQIEHKPVPEVSAGQEFGLGVTGHAREHDVVYKVTAPLP